LSLFIGLMSGTSLDGVDGVLARFGEDQGLQAVLAHAHRPLSAALAQELLALNRRGDDELHRSALAAQGLMRVYADVTHALLQSPGDAARVRAIGAHGQTVRHRPQEFGGAGYTVQLVNGALLAEWTGIATVCDFRSADLAAGGQGAPLVPAFHAACLADPGRDSAVLNVGGIANLTLLSAGGTVGGFDTGPGNLLMNLWCRRLGAGDYDRDGAIAASGRVLPDLLARLLDEPFFRQSPPKSTGRDRFHAEWLDAKLAAAAAGEDVMATLAELTVRTVADALIAHMPGARRLLVCGGGAFNRHLMARWHALLPQVDVQTSAAAGVPPDQVEALAFAWLATRRLAHQPASLPAVTGARGARILGAVYPAP
jgi:anhydro-N-acetylmuramic acid kinase